MTATVNGLRLRKVMGRDEWAVPEPFGPDGWRMFSHDGRASVIATTADLDGAEWTHASIARQSMPTYEDLCRLHGAVWGEGYSHQVFVPRDRHVNIHEHALHLWGRADGGRVLPDFGFLGRI